MSRNRGKPLTPDALAKEFAKWATEAGLPEICRLHGLKKAVDQVKLADEAYEKITKKSA
jgi:hypothetical protein